MSAGEGKRPPHGSMTSIDVFFRRNYTPRKYLLTGNFVWIFMPMATLDCTVAARLQPILKQHGKTCWSLKNLVYDVTRKWDGWARHVWLVTTKRQSLSTCWSTFHAAQHRLIKPPLQPQLQKTNMNMQVSAQGSSSHLQTNADDLERDLLVGLVHGVFKKARCAHSCSADGVDVSFTTLGSANNSSTSWIAPLMRSCAASRATRRFSSSAILFLPSSSSDFKMASRDSRWSFMDLS